MNKEQFEGNWKQLKGKIKEKWGKFTNDDITRINGKYDQFLGALQKKYGYNKEKAELELKNWKLEHEKEEHRKEGHWDEHKHYDKDKKRKAG